MGVRLNLQDHLGRSVLVIFPKKKKKDFKSGLSSTFIIFFKPNFYSCFLWQSTQNLLLEILLEFNIMFNSEMNNCKYLGNG